MKKHLPSLKRVLLVITIIGDLIAILLLVTPFTNPTPVVLNAVHGDASLYFAADRQILLLPSMCANLEWKAGPIQSLYLNQEGKAGEFRQPYCPAFNNVAPIFTVTFQNGTSQDYKLDLTSELDSPQILLSSFAVPLLSFLALMLGKTTFMLRFLTGRARLLGLDIRIVLFIWMLIVMALYKFPFYDNGSILNTLYSIFFQFFTASYHG